MKIKDQLIQKLDLIIDDLNVEDISLMLEIPPNSELGDYAFPCFKLAKTYRKAPKVIADEIAGKLKDDELIERIEVVGAYINIFVNKVNFISNVYNEFCKKDKNYGESNYGEGKTVVIDYSSPNIAKSFHIGHLRTTVIGSSLYKIHKCLGYNTVGVNHLGDWGTQFGKLIVAYKKWGVKEEIESIGISELNRIYVKFHEEAEKDETLNEEARNWFTEMEKGNEEALELWSWFKEISMKEFNRVYELLGIQFDSFNGESFYNDKMQDVINELEDKQLLELSEGARIVDLSDNDMPPCLITKKDGSSLYATRDISAAIYRKKTYDFEKNIYVTAIAQNLHFSQWFKVIEKMGYDWHDKLTHVSFGMVSMNNGKLSTRKGNVILLEDLLRESIEKTKEIIEAKNPNLANKEEVAKQIGIGAIIFNDLFNNRIKDVVFSWENILNFDGETGPYIQYTNARACSLLKKGNYESLNKNINFDLVKDEYSMAIFKLIENFPIKIREAADKLEPSLLTRYIVEVAKAFNKFYNENPILVEDEDVKNARLSIVYAVSAIITKGLSLLGIDAPNQM